MSQATPIVLENWRDAMLQVAQHYRIECSPETVRLVMAWNDESRLEPALQQMARQAGLALRLVTSDLSGVTAWQLPLVAQLSDGQVVVVHTLNGDQAGVTASGDAGLQTARNTTELNSRLVQLAVLRPAESVPDSRVDEYIKPYQPHWLRTIVLRDMRPYGHIMLASMVANMLALAGILFSMQVYDRVVPAQSYPTLYVLFGGAILATLFAYIMRQARMKITDILGKRADLRVSDKVYGHALRVRNSARPQATGTFIAQLRELEQVREMMTSTTVAAIADLPFFLLFCVLFWYIAGGLVWVPLVAAVLLVVPGLMLQKRIRALAQANMRESSLRNAMLVESVQGMEDIKVLQAEQRFQNQWNHYNAVSADSGVKLRTLVGSLNNWAQTVQGAVFMVVVCVGAPLVMEGDMTTGVLVAASILSSRMLAPLTSVAQIINRWQQTKIAAEALNGILQLPVDNPQHEKRIHLPTIRGEYEIRNAVFAYDQNVPALRISSLRLQPGERVAVLGKNGAGKSTLLQALSGLMEASSGTVLLDGVNMARVDPADIRRDIGLVSQNARLFHGTLRENLTLGAPHATDHDIMSALQAAGAWAFIQQLPSGLDYLVKEGGLGLSGGQRQSLLLARQLIRNPVILLLDEPTASLDESAEKQVMASLANLRADQTLVIATHRTATLALVDRIIVLDQGRIVLDDAREAALKRLRAQARIRPATAADAPAEATPVPSAAKTVVLAANAGR